MRYALPFGLSVPFAWLAGEAERSRESFLDWLMRFFLKTRRHTVDCLSLGALFPYACLLASGVRNRKPPQRFLEKRSPDSSTATAMAKCATVEDTLFLFLSSSFIFL